MGRTELPQKLWGRWVRPLSLAIALADMAIAQSAFPIGGLAGIPGILVGIQAALASVLLWLGFGMASEKMMQAGLLLSGGAWASRMVFTASEGYLFTAWMSFCWTVAALGAFWLERSTGEKKT